MWESRYQELEPNAVALTPPVSDRDDLEGEAFTIPVEVPEGVDLLHIPLQVQSVYPFRYEVIQFFLQFYVLRVVGPGILASGLSTQPCSRSAMGTTLLLGILKHHG